MWMDVGLKMQMICAGCGWQLTWISVKREKKSTYQLGTDGCIEAGCSWWLMLMSVKENLPDDMVRMVDADGAGCGW